MRRTALLLAVAAVVVAASAATAATAGPVLAPSTATNATGDAPAHAATFQNRTNTTNVLRIETAERRAQGSAGVSLSTALAVDRSLLEGRLTQYTLAEQFESASTMDARRAVLADAVTRAESRVEDLLAAADTARRQFADGNVTVETYLGEVARVQARASAIERALAAVDRYEDGVTGTGQIQERRLLVEAKLATLHGPVRAHAADAVRGRVAPTETHVAVTDDAAVLSAVLGGDFVHETALQGNRTGGRSTIPIEDAADRFGLLYPWAIDEYATPYSGLVGAYLVNTTHDHGRLVSYLDGRTGEVYREIQTKAVTGLPRGEAVTSTRGALQLTVNRSYVGGPLRVAFRSTSGEELDGQVRVNDRLVGTTGADGVLWTVAPASQFIVSVDYRDSQITFIVHVPSEG